MANNRPATPPDSAAPRAYLTPEQVRTIEINRLKAKALREHREAEKATDSLPPKGFATVAGQKRSFAAFNAATPETSRDAKKDQSVSQRPLEAIQPARNFAKYIEYDFSRMTDTRGGFLAEEDEPQSRISEGETKPTNMTLKEWERQQLLRSLQSRKTGPFEPGISALNAADDSKRCRECKSLEIDWKWEDALKCAICNPCKEKFPEKYSLLTKTEAKEDYLLTDPELKDENLLPHLERPNPHKSTWNNMMLYLRFQVEEYAFSERKWGSAEALDEEFTRRESEKKRRKEAKFQSKLQDLKKRTRVEAWRRRREGGTGGNFGDDLGGGKHTHEWSRPIEDSARGVSIKTCIGCGLEVEEIEF